MGRCGVHDCALTLYTGYCPYLYCPECEREAKEARALEDGWGERWVERPSRPVRLPMRRGDS